MKNAVIYHFALILIIITFISCENEGGSDDSRYRLLQIADNAAMENPFSTFEYNSQGKIVKIFDNNGSDEIEYNQNGNPVKISSFDLEYGGTSPYRIKTIQWEGSSFIVTESDWQDRKEIFHLNDRNQLESRIRLTMEYGNPEYDTTDVTTFTNISNDKIKIVREYYPIGSGGWEETFTLGTLNSPYKGIDVAVLWLTDVCFGEWEMEFQNEFNIVGWGGGSLKATINYDVEYGKYPVRADISYNASSNHEYVYFLYEEY